MNILRVVSNKNIELNDVYELMNLAIDDENDYVIIKHPDYKNKIIVIFNCQGFETFNKKELIESVKKFKRKH